MNTLPQSFRSLFFSCFVSINLGRRQCLIMALVLVQFTSTVARAEDHAQCETHGGQSTMFEPGVTPPVIEDNGLVQPNFVLLSGPWSETAYDGQVEQGDAFTITYSFVPDGTMIPGRGEQEEAPSNLFATMDANFPGGRNAWQGIFHQVFARYGEMTNISFVHVPDDGAAFGISFPLGIPGQGEPGEVGARGDMRISMREIGDGPLASNWAPTFGGDMIMDSLDVATFANPTHNFRSMRNVLFHEIGHGLGLHHVLPQDSTKLMEPVLNTAFDGPQEDELRAIHFQYGDRYEPNNNVSEYAFLDMQFSHVDAVGEQTIVVDDLAIEREESEDWYGVTVAGSVLGMPGLAIRLEPIGTEYQYGPDEEGASIETVDASSVRDLKLELYRRVSVSPHQMQLISTIDFNGAREAEYRPPAAFALGGLFYIRVYCEDGVNDVQRYRLTVSNVAIEAPQPAPAMFVYNGQQPVYSGSPLDMPTLEVGQNSGYSLMVSNTGEGALQVNGVTVQGPAANDYTAQIAVGLIQPGGFGILGVTFAPTAPGQRVAVLTVSTNDPAGDYTITLRGTATETQIGALLVSVDGETVAHGGQLDLGEIELGGQYEIPVSVDNIGNSGMSVFNTTFLGDATDDFERLTDLPLLLDEAEAGELLLSVTPLIEGEFNTTLCIFNNGTQSPYDVIFNYTVAPGEAFDDCNSNGIDDETELDTDGNGTIDDCEIVLPPVEEEPIIEDGGDVVGDADGFEDGAEDGDGQDQNDGHVDEGNVNDGNINEDQNPVVEDEDQNNDQDIDNDEQQEKRTGFCGAGSIGMLGLTMLGLGGTRASRPRPRRRSSRG